MGFNKDYVGGALVVKGNTVDVHSVRCAGYTDIRLNEPIQSANWSGDDVIVVTTSGKAYRYTNNITSAYA